MSLGALTTQFTPAPSCLATSNLWFIRTTSASVHEYNFFGRPLDAAQGCFPPGYSPASISYYSPAICPSGYTAASGTSRVIAGTVTESTEVCCPTAFLFRAQTQDNDQHPFLRTLLCESLIPTPFGATVTSTATGQASSRVISATVNNAINAYAVLVRRNNFDQISGSAGPTSTPSGSTNADSSSTGSSNSGATGGGTTSGEGDRANKESGSLGTGASIGIGVGVGVVVLGLFIAIVFLLLRRRKRNKNVVEAAMMSANAHKENSPLPMVQYRHELGSTPHEMDGSSMRVEQGVSDHPQELNGSYAEHHRTPVELPGTQKGGS